MIRALLESEGGRCRLLCEGHAEGSPALCAAVSCLICTVAGWVRFSGIERFSEELTSGKALLEFAEGAKSDMVLTLAAIGLLQLEKHDPARIKVTINNFLGGYL